MASIDIFRNPSKYMLKTYSKDYSSHSAEWWNRKKLHPIDCPDNEKQYFYNKSELRKYEYDLKKLPDYTYISYTNGYFNLKYLIKYYDVRKCIKEVKNG